jgi:DNA-binding Lrp family transcriptional regulator
MNKPDEKDLFIIDELKKNSKLSEQKIARKTGIPMTTVHNRIRKLRDSGIIEGYTIKVDYAKLGKPLIAFVLVKAAHGDQKELLKKIAALAGVYETAMITGEFDILFKARVSSMEELNGLIVQNLRKQKTIAETRTMVCYELIEKA